MVLLGQRRTMEQLVRYRIGVDVLGRLPRQHREMFDQEPAAKPL